MPRTFAYLRVSSQRSSRSSPVESRRRSAGSPSRYMAPCEHSSVTRFGRYAEQVNLEQRQEDDYRNAPLRLPSAVDPRIILLTFLDRVLLPKALCIHFLLQTSASSRTM